MKLYTKTGDGGQTGLIGGNRLSKGSLRIDTYGTVDELNSLLGCVLAVTNHPPLKTTLTQIQEDLFVLGSQLASLQGGASTVQIPQLTSKHVDSLERQIDVINETLSPLKNFILPGGGQAGAFLHLSRAICRRAERKVVMLSETGEEEVDKWALIYLNRLSDLLFTLARLANQLDGKEEAIWKA